ncbi:MAG: cyclase family protein [Nitrososphaerota archaeon]|nr:cyclase family protein [Nitrososphaerota archaeon]
MQSEVGALDRITPEVLLSSLKIVRQGRVTSLAQMYETGMPTVWFHGPFFYSTYRTVESCLKDFKEYTNRLGSTVCRYELSDHTGTHVDSLNHASVGYELYNGFDIRDIQTDSGTTHLGIDTMPPVITRGVLLDFPEHFGLDMLEEEYEITKNDIETLLKKTKSEIRPGDAVLFYTGYCKLWMKDNTKYLGNAPGVGVNAAKWLARMKIAVTGADTSSFDVVKANSKLLFPCHQVLIKEHGIHLVENLKLDEIANQKVREFMFVCTPLKIKGGAGSPVAPIAVY